MLEGIKNYLHHRGLQRKLKAVKSSHHAVNFASTKNIGLLFNATYKDDVDTILAYKKRLEKAGKTVWLLGFIDTKKLSTIPVFPFFTRKDVNWYGHPKDIQECTDFKNKELDLLVNAYTDNCIPLEWMSAFANAKFRIGVYFGNNNHCNDVMIDTSNSDDSLAETLKLFDRYLQMIKTEAHVV